MIFFVFSHRLPLIGKHLFQRNHSNSNIFYWIPQSHIVNLKRILANEIEPSHSGTIPALHHGDNSLVIYSETAGTTHFLSRTTITAHKQILIVSESDQISQTEPLQGDGCRLSTPLKDHPVADVTQCLEFGARRACGKPELPSRDAGMGFSPSLGWEELERWQGKCSK